MRAIDFNKTLGYHGPKVWFPVNSDLRTQVGYGVLGVVLGRMLGITNEVVWCVRRLNQ